MAKPQTYVGIDKEIDGGMTAIGKIIRDAKVFNLIPDEETCKGWNLAGIDALLDKVNIEWDKYGCSVSQLPDGIRQRHDSIHGEAIAKAKALGWYGEQETDNET